MERSTGLWRRVTGSPFQVAGPATEKARRYPVAVLERKTIRFFQLFKFWYDRNSKLVTYEEGEQVHWLKWLTYQVTTDR